MQKQEHYLFRNGKGLSEIVFTYNCHNFGSMEVNLRLILPFDVAIIDCMHVPNLVNK